MNYRGLFALSCTLALTLAGPAGAHHSFAMFDFNRRLTFEGTVEEFDWANPHAHIVLNVPATARDPATVGRWDIEGQAPNIMRRQGWTKTSIKPGDKITIVAFAMRNGSKAASLYYAVVNGKDLYGDPNRRNAPPAPGTRPPAGGAAN